MLVLSRKEGEQLLIGDNIVLTINRLAGNRVAIGIDAPKDVRVVRGELQPKESRPMQPQSKPLQLREPSIDYVDTTKMGRSFASTGMAVMHDSSVSVASQADR
ncbi:hypothetical protein CA13_21520 [Planctomycetes bacterium CA13]|uniref:Translational regulator CsrA n=1 Tax=Novipirellula herctigrandis TaxID=2527986 RepID=A0A5C5Z120_9BACT|nr:hypothetical protein CA13_21520 [Planctomycetes bacterium CA13]